jgi:hypothetical protein
MHVPRSRGEPPKEPRLVHRLGDILCRTGRFAAGRHPDQSGAMPPVLPGPNLARFGLLARSNQVTIPSAPRAGWPWRLPARAPTDPDVRALTHPVLQPTASPSRQGSTRLSERVAWTGSGASMCPTCFPRLGLPADASLPSTGSSGASSPASTVVSKRYDCLPPLPPRFVAFAWRYLGCTRFVRSGADECAAPAWSW